MIEQIENNETGLSVRTKLNTAIDLLNAGCVFGGTADPTPEDDPGTTFAIYIQKPLGALWLWFDGEWHFKG